jgi:6-phosphofructokinase 1
MNACIRAIVRNAAGNGVEVVGIKRGYAGILTRDMVKLGPRAVANIIQQGGTFLGTSRCEEMKDKEGRRRVIQILNEEGIEGLVALGGDGTLRGAAALAEEGQIAVVGVPATIDNDVSCTDYTIGFDTALNTALDAIDKIRDTAESLERPFFVEVMGRMRGFIALEVGIAGGAEKIVIPESAVDIPQLCRDLERNLEMGKRSAIIVVAEGDIPGGALKIAQQVKEHLGIDYRICVLGHVQRGGSPTARDRILASKLGVAAVDALSEGKSGYMVGEVRGEIALAPLRETWKQSKELDSYLLQLIKILAT